MEAVSQDQLAKLNDMVGKNNNLDSTLYEEIYQEVAYNKA